MGHAPDSDSAALAGLRHYLNEKNIDIKSAAIRKTGAPDNCEACICKTGNTFFITILRRSSSATKLREIGFEVLE